MSATDELDWTLMFEEERGQSAGVLPASLQPGPSHHQLGPRAFDCPSIQITSIANNSHAEPGGAEGGCAEGAWPRDQLYLPLDPSYRDPTLCPSPCSSMSSRSWMSDLSSCESFCHDEAEAELGHAARLALGSPLGSPGCGGGAFGVELWQQKYQHPMPFSPALSPFQSPCPSPRTSVTEDSWLSRRPSSRPSSRPTSPFGKRRHSGAARSPSPHRSPTPGASPRGSVTEDSWVGSPGGVAAVGPLPPMCSYQELDVPSKTRRTAGGQLAPVALAAQGDGTSEDAAVNAFLDSPREEAGGRDQLADLFLQVPAHFSWSQPAPEQAPGHAPLYRSASPPPLDAPLPSHCGQYQLTVEVQPRSHHRAHYETEGSRGAIKATAGGHPVVTLGGFCEHPLGLQLFIGTADERVLRPHAFYQVHRVTGKTVTTSCQEKMVDGTKVLEVPLLPQSNMSASIDCAGILKLRNADIELRRGETDVGRKNTRVRVVFRTGVPQTDGRLLWLQTTSIPVECSQRCGQELPQVQSFSPSSCTVDGGPQLLMVGSNISQQSKVVFVEKGADGRTLWEVEASVLPEQSRGSSVAVAIPTYSGRSAPPVQVNFYVSNGKRRRSLTQSFTYLPRFKREQGGPERASHPAPALDYHAFHLLAHHGTSSHDAPGPHPPMFPVEAQADELLCYIKKEPEEARLREITLDDVNEVIDRDIGGPSHCNQQPHYGPPQCDQHTQCSWQHAPQ